MSFPAFMPTFFRPAPIPQSSPEQAAGGDAVNTASQASNTNKGKEKKTPEEKIEDFFKDFQRAGSRTTNLEKAWQFRELVKERDEKSAQIEEIKKGLRASTWSGEEKKQQKEKLRELEKSYKKRIGSLVEYLRTGTLQGLARGEMEKHLKGGINKSGHLEALHTQIQHLARLVGIWGAYEAHTGQGKIIAKEVCGPATQTILGAGGRLISTPMQTLGNKDGLPSMPSHIKGSTFRANGKTHLKVDKKIKKVQEEYLEALKKFQQDCRSDENFNTLVEREDAVKKAFKEAEKLDEELRNLAILLVNECKGKYGSAAVGTINGALTLAAAFKFFPAAKIVSKIVGLLVFPLQQFASNTDYKRQFFHDRLEQTAKHIRPEDFLKEASKNKAESEIEISDLDPKFAQKIYLEHAQFKAALIEVICAHEYSKLGRQKMVLEDEIAVIKRKIKELSEKPNVPRNDVEKLNSSLQRKESDLQEVEQEIKASEEDFSHFKLRNADKLSSDRLIGKCLSDSNYCWLEAFRAVAAVSKWVQVNQRVGTYFTPVVGNAVDYFSGDGLTAHLGHNFLNEALTDLVAHGETSDALESAMIANVLIHFVTSAFSSSIPTVLRRLKSEVDAAHYKHPEFMEKGEKKLPKLADNSTRQAWVEEAKKLKLPFSGIAKEQAVEEQTTEGQTTEGQTTEGQTTEADDTPLMSRQDHVKLASMMYGKRKRDFFSARQINKVAKALDKAEGAEQGEEEGKKKTSSFKTLRKIARRYKDAVLPQQGQGEEISPEKLEKQKEEWAKFEAKLKRVKEMQKDMIKDLDKYFVFEREVEDAEGNTKKIKLDGRASAGARRYYLQKRTRAWVVFSGLLRSQVHLIPYAWHIARAFYAREKGRGLMEDDEFLEKMREGEREKEKFLFWKSDAPHCATDYFLLGDVWDALQERAAELGEGAVHLFERPKQVRVIESLRHLSLWQSFEKKTDEENSTANVENALLSLEEMQHEAEMMRILLEEMPTENLREQLGEENLRIAFEGLSKLESLAHRGQSRAAMNKLRALVPGGVLASGGMTESQKARSGMWTRLEEDLGAALERMHILMNEVSPQKAENKGKGKARVVRFSDTQP